MSGWTKGPWEIVSNDINTCDISIGDSCATVHREGANGLYVISREEMLENARLIAAAPDLAEALQAFVFALDLTDMNIGPSANEVLALRTHARAALAKAGAQ